MKKFFNFSNKKTNPAFTLVETLVTIGIFTIILLGITYLVFAGFRYYNFILNQAEIVSSLQKSTNAITKEIREMKQADSGSFALSTGATNEIAFYSNIDAATDVERIRYFKSGSCLKKGVLKPTGTPARYLDANEVISDVNCTVTNTEAEPIFTFYSGYPSDASKLTFPIEPTNVKVVKIFLRISSSGVKAVPESKTISIYVTPRNINLEE